MAAPRSSTHTGWFLDAENSRLAYYYKGTKVGHINASGFTITDGTTPRMTDGLLAAAGLGANLKTGYVPLPLDSWRLTASDDIPAIAVASGNGGNLGSDTAPSLKRIATTTDKNLRIAWAAAGVVELMQAFAYPPDLDDAAIVTFNMLAAMAGATDIPVVAVSYWEGLGDTNAGGNTAAVTGTTITQYTRDITAANIGAYPKSAGITLIPAAHGTDILYMYATWMTYTRRT